MPDEVSSEVLQKAEFCDYCGQPDVHKCVKCQKKHCVEHTSKYSPNFCSECLKHLVVITDKYTKTEEEYDEVSDSTIRRRSTCDVIRMDGPDYVWHCQWIHLLNDEELGAAIEFHRHMVSMIETARDVRKVRKNEALRREGVTVPSIKRTTETRVKKEVKQVDLVKKFIAMGMSENIAKQMAAIAQGQQP